MAENSFSDESSTDFRTAYCRLRQIPPERFEQDVLRRTLTWNARLARSILRLFHPSAFHAEKSLVRQAGDKVDFEDVRLDIDFYQHKHVVNSPARELLRFRVSGRRLQRLAREAFRFARGSSDQVQP